MNYEDFIEEVRRGILSHLSADFSGAEVKITPNHKVNYDTHSLTVVSPNLEDKVAPSMDLKMSYERYKKSQDMDEVLDQMANMIEEAYKDIDRRPELANLELNKENVFMQLINTDSNQELLAESPHRSFHDMSLIYRMKMGLDDDGLMSVKITNDLMESMGLTEQELFDLAAKQTPEMLPPKIQSMNDVLLGFMSDTGLDDLDGEELLESMGMGLPMMVVSNQYGIHGATNMVFDNVLHDVAEKIGDDIYVIPSSTHEFLAISQSLGEPEEIQEMVSEINQNTVKEQDRLSNQVFAYDRTARELTVAAASAVKGVRDTDYMSKVAERSEYMFDMPQPSRAR